MSVTIDLCNHSSEILDVSSGEYICTLCGLVLDRFFEENPYKSNKSEDGLGNTVVHNYISEILSKLNVPLSLTNIIYSKAGDGRFKDDDICQLIYDTLIEREIPFTLKEIAAVSGISTKKIRPVATDTSICLIDEEKVLERCCSKLGLTYSQCTVIKKSLNEKEGGFSPSTVIAAQIYKFCKNNKIKLKLRLICETVGVSTMSVHRYIRRRE